MSEELEVTAEDIIDTATSAPAGKQYRLIAFSNDPGNGMVVKQLEMVYQIVLSNQLGIMHARNDETGDIETILVGIDRGEEGELSSYPLARILGPEDVNKYSPPDGAGGYLSDASDTVN